MGVWVVSTSEKYGTKICCSSWGEQNKVRSAVLNPGQPEIPCMFLSQEEDGEETEDCSFDSIFDGVIRDQRGSEWISFQLMCWEIMRNKQMSLYWCAHFVWRALCVRGAFDIEIRKAELGRKALDVMWPFVGASKKASTSNPVEKCCSSIILCQWSKQAGQKSILL